MIFLKHFHAQQLGKSNLQKFNASTGFEYVMSARCQFPFRKRSLPFLTVDAIIANQAFSHDRCNIRSEF